MKQFYSHIVEVETIYIELDTLEVTEKEKKHLKHLVDTSLYHTILDAVLLELHEEDRKMFLDKVAEENHEATMDFLRKRVLNVEGKIKHIAKDLIHELQEDIREVKG